MAGKAGEAVLGVDDLSIVLTEIIEAQSQSYYVGLSLGVPSHVLKSIHERYANPQDRLLHTVTCVLEQVHPEPTWRAIADALKSRLVNLPRLAQTIEETYCSQMQPTPAQGTTPSNDTVQPPQTSAEISSEQNSPLPGTGTTPSNGAVQPPVTSPTSAELSEEQNSPLPGTTPSNGAVQPPVNSPTSAQLSEGQKSPLPSTDSRTAKVPLSPLDPNESLSSEQVSPQPPTHAPPAAISGAGFQDSRTAKVPLSPLDPNESLPSEQVSAQPPTHAPPAAISGADFQDSRTAKVPLSPLDPNESLPSEQVSPQPPTHAPPAAISGAGFQGTCAQATEVVKSDIDQLKEKFESLKNATREELEKAGVAVQTLVDKIMSFPVTKIEPHEEFLMKYADIFRESKRISSVFDRLSMHWDYLNYDILDHLITVFKLHKLSNQLDDYRRSWIHFLEHTDLEIFCEAEEEERYMEPPDGFKTLVSRHDWKKPISLQKVDDFRRRFAYKYDLRACAIFLLGVGKGSVIVTLLVPCSIELMLKSTESEFFTEHGITRLELNGTLIYSQGQQVKSDLPSAEVQSSDQPPAQPLPDAALSVSVKESKETMAQLGKDPIPAQETSNTEDLAGSQPPQYSMSATKVDKAVDTPQMPTTPFLASNISRGAPTITGPPATSAKGQTVPVDEYDFVETPSADFFCPVLKDLLLQPHLTTCCGHHFSVEAADRIKTEGAPCPICKDPNFTTVLDKRFRRQVFELKVFCRHKTRGCKWVGELSAFEHHMESCPRQNSPIESHSSDTIEGVDIVASTTLKVVPGEALTYSWKECGLKVHLPANVLSPNTSPLSVTIQASLSGQFQLPHDMDLVSGVYKMDFSPIPSQTLPVTLEMQHCANLGSSDQTSSLSFISAKYMPGTLPHKFDTLPGGTFSLESQYASIDLSSMSSGEGIGVGRMVKEGRERLYGAYTCYIPQGPSRWLAHIAIIWDLDLYRKELESHYAKRGAEVGPRTQITISGEKIGLDIPASGIALRSGWSLQPLETPTVFQRNVNDYSEGRTISCFQLQLDFGETEEIPQELLHELKFIGVEPVHAFIVITRNRPLTEKEMNDMFEKAMLKGYIECTLILLVLVGVAGSGKTLFKNLVLGLPLPEFRISTALAEAAVRSMSICQVAVGEGGEGSVEWRLVSSKDMLDMVADAIKGGVPVLKTSWEQQPPPVLHLGTVEKSDSNTTARPEHSTPSSQDKKEAKIHRPDKVPSAGTGTSHASDLERLEAVQDLVAEFFEALETITLDQDLLQNIGSSCGSGKLMDVNWIYIVDSGGQPQFREMLPHFMHDSSAFILMQKLNESLGFIPSIEYRGEGSMMYGAPYQSRLTNEQVLCQYFQAIQSHMSRVFMVGTHRDLEHECSESRAAKDKSLLEAFRPVLGKNLALFQPGNPDQFMFPLNCKTPQPLDKETIERFRKAVMKLCSGKKVKIPLPWFVLEQLLRQLAEKMGVKVLSLAECHEVASKNFHMSPHVCNSAIQYLGQLNIIFYKPHILPGVVFCDSQVVLDKITDLVRCSHELMGGTPGSQVQGKPGDEWLNFRDYGKINIKLLEEEEFSSHYRKGLFTAKHFLWLLKGLLIAANLGKDEYFMPSLLQDLSPKGISNYQNDAQSCAAPMAICYVDKWLPVGIVPSLVAELQNHHGWRPLTKGVKPVCMYHNCMQFQLPGGQSGSVVLIDSIAFLELHLHTSGDIAAKVCPEIREMMLAGLEKAHQSLHYDTAEVEVGFVCSCECRAQTAHLATVDKWGEMWTCSYDQTKGDKLNERHTIWLGSAPETSENQWCHRYTLQGRKESNLLDTTHVGLGISANETDLTTGDLATVLEELYEARVKAYYLGLILKVPEDVLDTIVSQHGEHEDRLLHVIKHFLKQVEPKPTWKAIVDALKSPMVGLPQLSEKIEAKFCTPKQETERAGEAVLGVDDLSTVLTEIIEARSRSYYVGLGLGVPPPILESIRTTHVDQQDRLLHTVKYFLEHANPEPTWRAISDALKSPLVDLPRLAQTIEEKYCSKMQPTPAQGSDRPTMMELLRFKGRTQVLNIPQRIGTATTKFGIHLLQDETGARVASILQSTQHRTEEANHQLLMEWVQGSGKMPVSWKTLVSMLDSAELHSLAQQIREVKL